MAFPQTPRPLAVEMFVNSTWTDITPDVYYRDKINITRGRPNESGIVPPATCQLTLDNRTGKYSSRNPTGPYYGSLNRNLPLRVAVKTDVDTFTRTVASAWGSTDSGSAWSLTGAGGSILFADWNVAAGVGTHRLSATAAYRISSLQSRLYQDVDVAATVNTGVANVLGGNLEPCCLLIGGLSTTDYYMAQVTISAAEVVQVQIVHYDGTVMVAPVTVPVTYTGQSLRVRFQLEGHSLRAKVWDPVSPEPYAWTAEVVAVPALSTYQNNRASGWVGIRSGLAAGNTNTLPLTYSYDNVEVRSYRFAGEISSWPSKWDTSGKDVYTQITASGMTRRLGQGDTPTPSAFYRAFTAMTPPPIAYWSMEDGAEATQMAAAVGGPPLSIRGATRPKLASNSDFLCSQPLPVVNGASFGDWYSIAGAPNTGTIQTTFLLSMPSSGDTTGFSFIQVQNSGTATYWNVGYDSSNNGSVIIYAFDRGGTTLLTVGPSDFHFKGRPVWCSLELVQNGTGIDWAFVTLDPATSIAGFISGNLASQTVGAVTSVKVNPDNGLLNSAIGHVATRNYYGSLFSQLAYLLAYAGETSRGRINRLSNENGIPFQYLYNGSGQSALIGTQARDAVMTLCAEAAANDMGVLYEGRSTSTLTYRSRSAIVNQTADLVLDYSLGHIVPAFEPVEDDQTIHNDVTVTRKNGSSVRAQQMTGALAVTNPFSGAGVGRYDTNITLNLNTDSQLPDSAGWILRQGTIDEPRYPSITVNLAKFASGQMDLDTLGVDIGGRISVINPKKLFDPNTLNQVVQGYRETIANLEHTITFNCTPGAAYDAVKLNTAAWDLIDSGSSTLSAPATSVATSLTVAVSSANDLWHVGSGLSIPIKVGGEAMTVTAIAGATSPQTFTVTRSTNGVVKAQAAGTSVQLARRATIAL